MKRLKLNLNKVMRGLAALAIVASAGAAQAALLDGKTVSFTYLLPTINVDYPSSANGNYVVGAGVEISNGFCCGYEGTLNLSDTNILADFIASSAYNSAVFSGFRISDVNSTIGDFTGVTINGLTNMVGFNASRVTFDANNIWVNLQSLAFTHNTFVSLDINGGNQVPEPAGIALLALGLLAASAAGRRSRN